MARLPPSANTKINEAGLIYGNDFNDTYFSRENGLEESRAVFLAGCGLPSAWAGRSNFVVGELGFGTGLNILALWDLWRQNRPEGGVLHIYTVEGYLLEPELAQATHALWPELCELSARLIGRWPTRAYGTQRLWFPEDGITLNFLIGPCEDVLARADFKADCWFLDGFAPSRNPHMWSQGVFTQIARLSKPNARAATYSVAGIVRSALHNVGFEIARLPGFGTKRQRLEAKLTGEVSPDQTPISKAIVIGGGIGGAAACAALARRGCQVDLIDGDPCGRTKASGNPVAMIMPRLDKGDTRDARFYRAAYLMACDEYQSMPPTCFDQTGVIEFGEDDKALERLEDLVSDPPLPPSHFQSHEDGTIAHRRGGLVFPDQVLAHLTKNARKHPVQVARIEHQNGQWCAIDHSGETIAQADVCVMAAGVGVGNLCDLGIELGGRAGQLSFAKVSGELPPRPVSGGGYAATFHDRLVFGATYEAWSLVNTQPPDVTEAGHLHNLGLLTDFVPELAKQIDMTTAHGRCSIRVTTPDQMPIAGRIPNTTDGLYVMAGLGSRGFTTSFLCAETLASEIFGEPSPLETACRAAIAPDRFARRIAKRGQTPKTSRAL